MMNSDCLSSQVCSISRFLQEDEEVLWMERRRKIFDSLFWGYFGIGSFLFGVFALMVLDCLEPGGHNPDEIKYWLFLPLLGLLPLGCAAYILRSRLTTRYILTNRRALVLESPFARQKMMQIPLWSGLVHIVKRYPDGTTSYLLAEPQCKLEYGFERLQATEDLEKQLRRLGVRLPSVALPKPPSAKRLCILSLILAFSVYTIARSVKSEPMWQLLVYGERTVGTITGFRAMLHKESRKKRHTRRVLRYHPILSFRTIDGSSEVSAVSILGDKYYAGQPGERVEILYNSRNPSVASRIAYGRFFEPAIVLVVMGISSYLLLVDLYRLRRYRPRRTDNRRG